jgi:septal ring factor EnvC (AmiA/AmiB activator)
MLRRIEKTNIRLWDDQRSAHGKKDATSEVERGLKAELSQLGRSVGDLKSKIEKCPEVRRIGLRERERAKARERERAKARERERTKAREYTKATLQVIPFGQPKLIIDPFVSQALSVET